MRERSPSTENHSVVRRFFSAPFEAQTYRNLLFLIVAFPLGVSYFVIATVGLSVGAGLASLLVGIPLLLATLFAIGQISRVEAHLTNWLLDVTVDVPNVPNLTSNDGATFVDSFTTFAEQLVTSRATWAGIALILLKFVFGVVAFSILVTAVAVVGTLLSMPVFYDATTVQYAFGPYSVTSIEQALAGSLVGLALAFVTVQLLNGLAHLGGSMTEALVGRTSDTSTGGVSGD